MSRQPLELFKYVESEKTKTETTTPELSYKIKFNMDWSEDNVNNWFKKRKISESIIEYLSPCNGNLLEQLYITLIEIPEFFHSMLRADSRASLKEIVYFASELRQLFQ